jgi:hypothetical protein
MARYLVEAHVLGGRPVSELAAAHGVHRSWIYKLIARYRDGGHDALRPRSRRPRSCKHQTPVEIVERIVVDVFHKAAGLHGLPACLLSDNGAVFTATPRKGKVLLQTELERLGITNKNSRPYHPQTCGKIERLHQTLKRYLARQKPARTLTELQAQLDAFAHYYNTIRPHRALHGRTPLQAYSTRIKATPTTTGMLPATHFRVRQDKVDKTGRVTLRHNSRLHHIGIGRGYKGRTIKLLIADSDIRIIDANTGQLIRELTLDPTRDYQPLGRA